MNTASTAVTAERNTSVIRLDKEVHQMVKRYSDIVGVPMSQVLADALTDWMGSAGAARIEALRSTQSKIEEILKFPNSN